MPAKAHSAISTIVLLLTAYSVIKLTFFFALPYEKRRAALNKAYKGRAYATNKSDIILLVVTVLLAGALLADGAEPISFLGGLFIGATLIQLFFHAFHASVPPGRDAPEPRSPLKEMSYAIQDRPQRAWKEMTAYAVIAIAGMILYLTH